MKFVHAVGDGVGERIFLRVELPALIIAIASVRSIRIGAAPSSSNVRRCTSLGSTLMRMPSKSAGSCTGRKRLEMCRKPFSNQPRMR